MGHRYRFHTRWTIPAAPGPVYTLLVDVAGYPRWWPQILDGRQDGDGVGEIRVRSALPYELTLELRREIEDPVARVLRAGMDGDLVGWSEWHVTADGAGSVVDFREEVELGHRGLRRLPTLVRPILSANHAYMMRGGERGMRQHVHQAP